MTRVIQFVNERFPDQCMYVDGYFFYVYETGEVLYSLRLSYDAEPWQAIIN